METTDCIYSKLIYAHAKFNGVRYLQRTVKRRKIHFACALTCACNYAPFMTRPDKQCKMKLLFTKVIPLYETHLDVVRGLI